ncbi:MAG: TetR/AcrR family transcriptional regulator [Deltaproteobacteria bacterium]|nr:MAG: TetR/AcrR family transcriptional regulator [Deltaproteobacteria bacterium]
MIGRRGYDRASMGEVAREAGVSKGLLHYHFASKEDLLLEAQRVTFRQLHQRFTERARQGQGGLDAALEALDAMWRTVRELRGGAPFIVETLALASHDGDLNRRVANFYQESTQLLEDAIRAVFADELDSLAVSPDRMAVLIRVLLEGLTVELAQARTEEERQRVDQAYLDFRALFQRFVLTGQPMPAPDLTLFDQDELTPVPLPW